MVLQLLGRQNSLWSRHFQGLFEQALSMQVSKLWVSSFLMAPGLLLDHSKDNEPIGRLIPRTR